MIAEQKIGAPVRITFITLLLLCLNLGCRKQESAHAPLGQSHAEDVLTYEDSEEAHAAAKAKVAAEAKAKAVIEEAIRKQLKKPTGELTKVDLEKVTKLELFYSVNASWTKKLTDVKGLEKLPQLTELNLNGNQLTNVKGLEKLMKLKTLRLERNQLTNVKGLGKLDRLTYLNLVGNPDLTKAQIDQLKKALPNCKIYSNPKK